MMEMVDPPTQKSPDQSSQIDIDKAVQTIDWKFKSQATYHQTKKLGKISVLVLLGQIVIGLSMPFLFSESFTEVVISKDTDQNTEVTETSSDMLVYDELADSLLDIDVASNE